MEGGDGVNPSSERSSAAAEGKGPILRWPSSLLCSAGHAGNLPRRFGSIAERTPILSPSPRNPVWTLQGRSAKCPAAGKTRDPHPAGVAPQLPGSPGPARPLTAITAASCPAGFRAKTDPRGHKSARNLMNNG